jgi:AraC-like DNA-binding protein
MVRSRSPATYRQDDLFGHVPPLPVLATVVELNRPVEDHAHDFLEVAVVSQGSGVHATSAGLAPAQPGDVYVLRPGAWHGFRRCRSLVVANCCIGSSVAGDGLAFLQQVADLRELLWTGPMAAGRKGVLAVSVPAKSAERTTAEVRRLATELRSRCINRVLLMSRLLAILGTLLQGTAIHQSTRTVAQPDVVDTVLRNLTSAPERPWTMDELAELVSLNPAYLSRLFRQHLGLPPIGYLARLRVERASVLLSQTDLSVAQVARAVGWPDSNYFARRFRALSGLSPTAYRKRRSAATQAHPDDPRLKSGALLQ